MENGITNVHIDSEERTILKNMTLKQDVKTKDSPSEITNSFYNNELENVLKESTIIEKEYKEGKRKGYNNANEMMKSIFND